MNFLRNLPLIIIIQHPLILFAYQTAKQNTTKITFFFLVYRREVRFPIHPQVQNDAVKRVEKAQESAKRKHDLQLPYC